MMLKNRTCPARAAALAVPLVLGACAAPWADRAEPELGVNSHRADAALAIAEPAPIDQDLQGAPAAADGAQAEGLEVIDVVDIVKMLARLRPVAPGRRDASAAAEDVWRSVYDATDVTGITDDTVRIEAHGGPLTGVETVELRLLARKARGAAMTVSRSSICATATMRRRAGSSVSRFTPGRCARSAITPVLSPAGMSAIGRPPRALGAGRVSPRWSPTPTNRRAAACRASALRPSTAIW